MADKFQEPREVIPLIPQARDMLASASHRLHHAAWHDVRNQWGLISEEKKRAIGQLGWQPGHATERPALRNGAPIVDNGSGEDFLFMHREMIKMVRAIYENAGASMVASWVGIPFPGSNPSEGFAVPPNWTQSDIPTSRRLAALKSDEYFWSAMRGCDRQFKNAAYLSSLSLGALGATLEFTVHNDMHMRWASAPRDPDSGQMTEGRVPTDFDAKWLRPDYDFLGEFYSSHVNPVFWRLHGWVDDRIDDWFRAHEVAHPGQVRRRTVDGVEWFSGGPWVSDERPWASPGPAEGHSHGSTQHKPDVEKMKQVITILHARDEAEIGGFDLRRPSIPESHRTWFLT